jgi:hypothetical protein
VRQAGDGQAAGGRLAPWRADLAHRDHLGLPQLLQGVVPAAEPHQPDRTEGPRAQGPHHRGRRQLEGQVGGQRRRRRARGERAGVGRGLGGQPLEEPGKVRAREAEQRARGPGADGGRQPALCLLGARASQPEEWRGTPRR